MGSDRGEILFEYLPLIRVFKNGEFERPVSIDAAFVSAGIDTEVSSKDVVIDPGSGLTARLYLPCAQEKAKMKLPLVVYYHGGGFCMGSGLDFFCHNYITAMSAKVRAVVVSVEYKIAPEHPIPAAHEDAWTALRWAVSCTDEWLLSHADMKRVFLAGDSAGGNLAYNTAMQASREGMGGINGVALLFPYFWGRDKFPSEREEGRRLKPKFVEEMWPYLSAGKEGNDHPMINPLVEPLHGRPNLSCKRLLVCVGGRDILRDRARACYESVKRSGWEGELGFVEFEGEDHCFHVYDPTSEKAMALMQHLADFLCQE